MKMTDIEESEGTTAKDSIRRLLPPSGIRSIFDRAAEIERRGGRVWHLEIGRPDWKLPPYLVEEAKQALDEGFVHYIANRGLLELRQAISDDLKTTTGRNYNPENEIIVTNGGSEVLAMCALALLGAGDEMIVPEPAWLHYKAAAEMAGAKPVPLSLSPDDGFLLNPELVASKITPRTRMIIVNTPGNPTGAVQPREFLQEIADLANKHGFFVLADEVYQDFVYEGQHHSMATIMGESDQLLLLNSFSKSYIMTGWRIGYIAAVPKISDVLNRIHQYLTVCGVSFAQRGAAKMLRHPGRQAYLKELHAEFQERYMIWRDAFASLPNVKLSPPKGAFYLFPRIDYRGMMARDFCQFMLEKHNVAMVPGDVFGDDFNRYVRISYGRELETQHEAAKIIVSVLKNTGIRL